jgi:hypothetical protein
MVRRNRQRSRGIELQDRLVESGDDMKPMVKKEISMDEVFSDARAMIGGRP